MTLLSGLTKRKPSLNEVKDFQNFRQMLLCAKAESGDTVAVKYKKRSSEHDVTYNELLSIVDALGTGLFSLDTGNKHVAIVAPNCFRFIAVYLAVLCSDGVVIPVDKELPFTEIVNILNHSDSETVFFDRAFTEQFIENKKLMPKIKNYVCLQMKQHEEHDGILSYEGIMDKGQAAVLEGNEVFTSLEPDDKQLRMLLYKNGSTDSLRGIMFSQFALRSAVKGVLQMTPYSGRCLSVMPYDRPQELVGGLLGSFASHATVCINTGLKNFQKDLKEYKPQYLLLPPLYIENIRQKVANALEKQGRTETLDTLVRTSNAMRKVGIDKRKSFFSSIHEMMGGELEFVRVVGASVNPDAVKFFDDVGISVLGGYSVSECASVVSTNREKQIDFDSAGTILPCMQIRIDDPDEDGSGEICVRGDVMMMGYYKNDRATKTSVELSGWFHTGDLGRLSEDGQLYVTGRLRNEIVLKNGRSILPEEMESYLLALPFVKHAKVYAGKDANGAELTLCAEISLDEEQTKDMDKSGRIALVKEKIDQLNHSLPSYKRLCKVRIVK